MFPRTTFQLEIVDECTSTNDELMNRRDADNFHGLALMARSQTKGQGRRGKVWWSTEGNLALSVGFRFESSENIPLLSITAGLAISELMKEILPSNLDFRLKWPNDGYINGRKLFGMLTHVRQQGNFADVVLGIGVNLVACPPDLIDAAPAISLSEACGAIYNPEVFARDFLSSWDFVLNQVEHFEDLRDRWEIAAKLSESKLYIVGESQDYIPVRLLPTAELEVMAGQITRRLSAEETSIRLIPVR